jgi:hypothetical protein
MRLHGVCFHCAQKDGSEVEVWGEYRDEGFIDVECPHGHRSRAVLQQQRFELLFDFGILALIDGYYRDSFATTATALERFLQFYLQVVARERGVEDEALQATLRRDVHRSEREIGAFAFVYLLENGHRCEPYFKHSHQWTKDRNDVVHNGHFPTAETAMSFGDATLGLIFTLGKELRARYSKACDKVVMSHVQRSHAVARKEPRPADWPAGMQWPLGLWQPTTIAWASGGETFGATSYQEAVEHMRLKRHRTWKP